MDPTFRSLFEEQIRFRLSDGTEVDGGVFIGSTEFLPVEILREDPNAYREELDLWLSEVWKPEQEERRAAILTLHANAKRYDDLVEAVERQQVVPFVGSGMSVPSGLPTWSDLLRRLRGFTVIDSSELEKFLCSSLFEEAADLLASRMNRRLLGERVEHELRMDDPLVITGAVRLLPGLFPNLVITTNLDNVLEHHYTHCDKPFAHVLPGSELARYRSLKNPNLRFLLKLHGDCRRMESRVLLTSEYEAAYAKGGTVREGLALVYRSNNLLFLGCSLGADRTVRLIEEIAGADPSMPKHYAFLACPADDMKRIERENFLTERGIYPIWYGATHDESITALLDGLFCAASGGRLQ